MDFENIQRRLSLIEGSNPYILLIATLISFSCFWLSAVDAHGHLSNTVFGALVVVCGLPVILSVLSGILLACATVTLRGNLNALALNAFHKLRSHQQSSGMFGRLYVARVVYTCPINASLIGDSLSRWLIKRKPFKRLATDARTFESGGDDHEEEDYTDDLFETTPVEDESA